MDVQRNADLDELSEMSPEGIRSLISNYQAHVLSILYIISRCRKSRVHILMAFFQLYDIYDDFSPYERKVLW